MKNGKKWAAKNTEIQIVIKKAKLKCKKNQKKKKKINSKVTFSALNKNKKQHLKQKKIE